jgi:hypothetical protein
MVDERQTPMATPYRRSKQNRSMEMTIIYTLIMMSAAFSVLLPYVIARLTHAGGAVLIP